MIRDLIALEDTSRVWVYQADREFTYEELDDIRPRIFDFLESWTSHNQSLMTYGNVFHKRFLAVFVDESISGASGCSIDKSVHFVESLGSIYNVDFFSRLDFCYMQEEAIYQIKSSELSKKVKAGDITHDTLFFNNLVKTKGEFLSSWIKPLEVSWHKRFI